MRSALWMLFLVACASAPLPEEPEPVPGPTDPLGAPGIGAQYYAIARRLWKQGELPEAERMIGKALDREPANDEYRRFQRRLRMERGDRSASVTLIADEAVASAQVKREEELVTVKRLLAEAERARSRQLWDKARRAYERALFVLETSRFREDADFRAISRPTRKSLSGLPDARAEAERRQRESDLKELAR